MCFDARKPEAGPILRAAGLARDGNPPPPAIPEKCPACGSRDIRSDESYPSWWSCRSCDLEWDGPVSTQPAPTPDACPACGSTDHSDIALDPPVRTCRACGWRGWVDADEGPVPPEDRGTPVWVWRDADGWYSFWKLPRAVERVEVTVPIGWRLQPDPEYGVVFGNVWGARLTAVAALHHAERGEGGFKLRKREAVA